MRSSGGTAFDLHNLIGVCRRQLNRRRVDNQAERLLSLSFLVLISQLTIRIDAAPKQTNPIAVLDCERCESVAGGNVEHLMLFGERQTRRVLDEGGLLLGLFLERFVQSEGAGFGEAPRVDASIAGRRGVGLEDGHSVGILQQHGVFGATRFGGV